MARREPEAPSRRSILPLPDDVVAQIKSSTAIASLHGVVLGLLENSLDAKATKIEATVDFARGGCIVQDNGLGIAPAELRQDGGLGKLYCPSSYLHNHRHCSHGLGTSKYRLDEASLGRNGTFLASLAAMSLLTIVSRHHEHPSHNMVTFHHSNSIDRQLPAPPQHDMHEKHGTRVTVRNLFGNLPVRVKQRALLAEQKPEYDRLWETLKKEVTGLLLSWCGQVSLRVRDADGRTSFSFSNMSRASDTAIPRSSGLAPTLQVLTQADYISFDDWSSWIPTSASTSAISIKGAISLDPAPSKHVQFLSFGVGPMSSEFGNNELYDEVNRIFSQSSFGIVEDDTGADENEKVRRQGDKRFKSDGYTNRQLTARKGVDRYPMFHLRFSLKSSLLPTQPRAEHFLGEGSNLQAVMEVLGAMITQWLSFHHFRPRKLRLNPNAEGSPSKPVEASDAESTIEPEVKTRQGHSEVDDTNFRSSEPHGRKKQRSKPPTVGQTLERTQHRAFAEWSRIKSGKAKLFDNPTTSTNNGRIRDPMRPQSDPVASPSSARSWSHNNCNKFDVKPMPAGSLNGVAGLHESTDEPPHSEECSENETMIWMDPSTKRTFLLNARTGCVLPRHPPKFLTDSTILPLQSNKSVRLPRKPATSDKLSTGWLSSVLETWDNPVFKPVQNGIQQACDYDHQFDELKQALNRTSRSSKLSAKGLQNAHILAQLDKKFIFAKIRNTTSGIGSTSEVLVLIDQHAADERVQVEALLAELCRPLPESHAYSGYRSKLGHRSHVYFTMLEKPVQFGISGREHALFITHAARFAAWGILFDADSPASASARQQLILSVTTLPPVVSERCKTDPRVLITLLRSAVWRYADATNTHPPVIETTQSDENQALWVRRLSTLPEGLIDLVNSRACRSAIMFNDYLSLDDCKELVRKLSRCVFPFMCAHGRPSMVPLVDLGAMRSNDSMDVAFVDSTGGGGGESARGSFSQTWKEWIAR